MPLWSNEEWRARIGSCWCALGRPFNTRFTRCRGKSRGMLTLHQVATMVIMMMLLIAANLGLAATQGHHKMFMNMMLFGDVIMELHAFRLGLILILIMPILKTSIQLIYHLLPHRVKTSLKRFYVDLTHSFRLIGYIVWIISSPAVYVMNSVTSGVSYLVRSTTELVLKWIQDDNMLSQGSPKRSLIMVIIVAIQLFVTMAVARSVIYFLLLTSGDVEQNPGPPNRTEFEGPGASGTYYQDAGWRYTSRLFILLLNKLFSWSSSAKQLVGDLYVLSRDLVVSMSSIQSTSSVCIVSALAIAIVVTMELETAASVQASLLLRCGDIELNPGPLEDEVLTLPELVNIMERRLINEACHKWKTMFT